jgi:hypothetical protein
MKKVLILGCSHSAGNYNPNDPANADKNSGWPTLIANTFLNYEVHCITHHGGGIINYMWSLGHLINKFGKDYFDKIIIQISNEPRLTMYIMPLHSVAPSLSSNDIKDSFLDREKLNISGTFYRYYCAGELLNYCKAPDTNNNKVIDNNYKFYDEGLQKFLSLNLYLVFMTENFLSIIKTMFDNSKLLSFRWNDYPNLSYYSLPADRIEREVGIPKWNQMMEKLGDITIHKWKNDFPFLLEKSAVEHIKDTVGAKQEILYQMSDNSSHYDAQGNEMVYKYLEPHLKEFLI